MQGLTQLVILSVVALAIGLLINEFRENSLPLLYLSKEERLQNSVEKIAEKKSVMVTLNSNGNLPVKFTLESFSHHAETKQDLILDARPSLFYRIGHVPGALSLPREDFEKGYAQLKGKLEANRAQPIVIYCSDAECEDSKLVRNSLRSLGYKNLFLFEGGWSAWSEAQKPVEVSK